MVFTVVIETALLDAAFAASRDSAASMPALDVATICDDAASVDPTLAGTRTRRISNLPPPTATFCIFEVICVLAARTTAAAAAAVIAAAGPADGVGMPRRLCALPGEAAPAARAGLMLRISLSPKLTRIFFFST